jgi:hypothetical protein
MQAGDRVRYNLKFLTYHPNRQFARHLAQLEGTIIDIYIVDGREVAQVAFGSIFRCTSMMSVDLLEKVT